MPLPVHAVQSLQATRRLVSRVLIPTSDAKLSLLLSYFAAVHQWTLRHSNCQIRLNLLAVFYLQAEFRCMTFLSLALLHALLQAASILASAISWLRT